MKEAGIEGKFTNHSLRATCPSRMFDTFVPEKIIKETTGHKSECIRVYKQTSEVFHEAASETQGQDAVQKKVQFQESDSEDSKFNEGEDDFLLYAKMVENVNKTKEEIRKKLYPKSQLKACRLVNKLKKIYYLFES